MPPEAGEEQQTPPEGEEHDTDPSQDDEEVQRVVKDEGVAPEEKIAKLSREAAKRRVALREAEKWVEPYGGKETVERIMKATQSTEGLTRLGLDALVSVGVSRKELERLILGEEEPAASRKATKRVIEEDDDDDDDEPMSKKELREYLSQFVEENVKKPLLNQRESDLASSVQNVIFDTLDGLKGIESEKDRRLVMKFAEDHAPREGDPDEFDPQRNKEAILAGYEDYKEFLESVGSSYLKRKEDEADNGPGVLSGAGSSGIKLQREPKNVEEAIEMANTLLKE